MCWFTLLNGLPERRGDGELSERGEGVKKNKLAVTEQSGDVKYSIGNTASNIATTVYGLSGGPEVSGEHIIKYTIL